MCGLNKLLSLKNLDFLNDEEGEEEQKEEKKPQQEMKGGEINLEKERRRTGTSVFLHYLYL